MPQLHLADWTNSALQFADFGIGQNSHGSVFLKTNCLARRRGDAKRKLRAEEFLVVRLTVDHSEPRPDYMARLTFHTDWDDDDPTLHRSITTQRIPYTDFPLDGIRLYLCNGVLMLPREY